MVRTSHLPALLLAAALALATPRLAHAQAPATTYFACVVSRPIVAVGTPVLMILTPAGAPWPLGVTLTPVATGLQGTFSPVSAVGVGTAPVLFAFAASAPGEGALSVATSMGMTEAPALKSQLAIQPACLAARQVLGGIPA